MSRFVLDASAASSFLIADEYDARAASILAELEVDGAVVPLLWHYEVRHALLKAERRGRTSREETISRLRSLDTMRIATDRNVDFVIAFTLARTHGLTFYDAIYLELAVRSGLTLATLDGALASAARVEGLDVIPA